MKPIQVFGLCLLIAAEVLPAQGGEGLPKEVRGSLEKFQSADSYAFTVEENKTKVAEAAYQKGQPLQCRVDKIDMFKKGDALVYLDAGKWLRSKRGTVSDPLRVLGAVSKALTLRLPHEELALLAKSPLNWTAAKSGQGQTFTAANLPPELTRLMVRPEHKGVAQTGSATLHLNPQGQIVLYQWSVRLQGTIGNAEIDGAFTRAVNVRDVGMTKVEVPAAARKSLE